MDILIPEVGESVREALLGQWFKKNGDPVAKDEPLCELETDKITLDVHADVSGVLTILTEAGTTLAIGSKIGFIAEGGNDVSGSEKLSTATSDASSHSDVATVPSSPSVRQAIRESRIDPATITPTGRGGRITLDDLFSRIEEKSRTHVPMHDTAHENARKMDIDTLFNAISPSPTATQPRIVAEMPVSDQTAASVAVVSNRQTTAPAVYAGESSAGITRSEERVALSPIRKRIGERLVAARQQTAMLTTFNEVDMSQVKALREKHREHFVQRHGVPLGLMPFFVKASCEALRQFPLLNACIDDNQIVYHHFYDIGVAIGGEKGLVVPVVRNADALRMFEIDSAISAFAEKIRTNRLAISDLEGGTFTISNGGVYGSMLSTPILNPPQSGVLGMHAIQDRAVVRDGQIVIRPMMYLALSYDHRLVDGREAVGFLKKIKEYLEDPEELLLEG